MRMGLKWSKCARPDHVRPGSFTRNKRARHSEGPARGDEELTQEGTTRMEEGGEKERRGTRRREEELCYEFTIAHCTILLLLVLLLFLLVSFSSCETVRIALTLFFLCDFLFLFSTSFPALLSSIYVPVSPSACAPSTPLAPTASPLMVSASAVSISAFYLLSAVSVPFFASLLTDFTFNSVCISILFTLEVLRTAAGLTNLLERKNVFRSILPLNFIAISWTIITLVCHSQRRTSF